MSPSKLKALIFFYVFLFLKCGVDLHFKAKKRYLSKNRSYIYVFLITCRLEKLNTEEKCATS